MGCLYGLFWILGVWWLCFCCGYRFYFGWLRVVSSFLSLVVLCGVVIQILVALRAGLLAFV